MNPRWIRGNSRNGANHDRAWAPSGATFSIVDIDPGRDDYEWEVAPALCAIELADQDDVWYRKSVRLDMDDCLGREDSIHGSL